MFNLMKLIIGQPFPFIYISNTRLKRLFVYANLKAYRKYDLIDYDFICLV